MSVFSGDVFQPAVSGGGGGGAPEPVFEHDFGSDPVVGVTALNIFEAGKSYKIVGKEIKADTDAGGFSIVGFDMLKSDGLSSGNFAYSIFVRNSFSGNTSSQPRGDDSGFSTLERLDFSGGRFANFELQVNNPNEDKLLMLNMDCLFVEESIEGQPIRLLDVKVIGGQHSITNGITTGFKYPKNGSMPLIGGTIKVFEL